MTEVAGLRLDKWLFFTRLCKSRSLAAGLCDEGEVRVNGEAVKPARTVRPGDVVEVRVGSPFGPGRTLKVRVVALGERRGPAPEARGLYEEIA